MTSEASGDIVENILKERYYQPGESSWDHIARRVAEYIGDDYDSTEQYYQAISTKALIPNSPALMNAGVGGSLSACFAVPVGDSIDEIFDAVKACAKIHKTGGGTGISLSDLRSNGSPVRGTGHVACLTGDTIVFTDQVKKTIKKQFYTLDRLFDLKCRHKVLPKRLRCVIDDNIIGTNEFIDIVFNGEQRVYKITTELGYSIKATFNHRFMNEHSLWQEVVDFKVGDLIAVNGTTAKYGICKRCGREGRIRNESSPKYAGYCNSCATSLWGNHALHKSDEHLNKLRKKVGECSRCGRILPLRGDKSKYKGVCANCAVSLYHGCSIKGSEEHLKKMSEAQKEKWTPELKEKMRNVFIGPNNAYYKGDAVSETTARSRVRTWYPDLDLSYCRLCGATIESGVDIEVHHIDCNPYNNALDNLQVVCTPCHGKMHQQIKSFGNPRLYKEIMFDEIVSIEDAGIERVFDIQMKYPYNNFIANGFVSHNSGPISFLKVFNEATETIKQGGKRRGANLGHLDVTHPDIKEFITCKTKEGDLSNFNLSVNISDEFMRHLDRQDNKEIFDLIVKGNWNNGEPGIIFTDTADRDNSCPHLGRLTGTNPCVRGDTLILTDVGYVRIEDVANKLVNIWNGFEYSAVTPKITGYNQHCLKIGFSDGSELICTDYHEFEIITRYRRSSSKSELAPSLNVKAIDLKIGDKLQKCKFPIIKDTITNYLYEPYAQGFFAGDGYYDNAQKKNVVHVHDDKQRCIDSISHSHRYNRSNGRIVTLTLSKKLKPKDFVPDSSYSVSDRLEFLAGLIDSDGCAIKSESGGIQISSVNHQFLIDVKLMINTLGENTKVTLMNHENVRDIKGHFYYCVDCYRLIIPQSVVWNLMEYGLKTRRVELPSVKPDRNVSQFVKVVKIEDAGIEPVVYCFTEPKNHTGIFNGVFTRQCAETRLFPWESCNLASINLMRCACEGHRIGEGIFDYEAFERLIRLGVRFLDDMIDKNEYPLPEIREATLKTRKIGLGVMGFADLLIYLGMRYGSPESIEFADRLFGFMRRVADEESVKLGTERGVYPASQGDNQRNAAVLSIAPTGSISLFAGVSSGIEPNFGWVYTRNTWVDGEKKSYSMLHPFFEGVLQDHACKDLIINTVIEHGTAQVNGQVWSRMDNFVVSKDISPMDHVRMQAAIQQHVDQAISKTINCPKETTEDEIARIIHQAWTLGCKGLTIYREGSRSDVVLETSASKSNPTVEVENPVKYKLVTANGRVLPKTPRIMAATLVKKNSGCGKMMIAVGEAFGGPHSVTIVNKGGCDAMTQALAELTALALRWGIPGYDLVKTLKGIKCSAAIRNPKSDGKSCPDILGAVIDGLYEFEEMPDKYIDAGEKREDRSKCPGCGGSLVFSEGCRSCPVCGYNRCS